MTMAMVLDHPVRDALRILLVDDDSDIRECLAELLRFHGVEVMTAGSGNEGFAIFLRERPDLVLSDLSMPDGDGFELIARIRARDPDDGGRTPAIALSADQDETTAITAGYHAFLAKPFESATLLSFIDDFSRSDDRASTLEQLSAQATTRRQEPARVQPAPRYRVARRY